MKARYENGVYRDCKWCHGAGCLACPAEAEKEYNRQFPDGPQPIATFEAPKDESGFMALLNSLVGPEAQMDAKVGAQERAAKIVDECEASIYISGEMGERLTDRNIKDGLSAVLQPEILAEQISQKSMRAKSQ